MSGAVVWMTLIAYTFSCQASNGFPGLEGTQVTNYSLWQEKPLETRSVREKASGSSEVLLNYTAADC